MGNLNIISLMLLHTHASLSQAERCHFDNAGILLLNVVLDPKRGSDKGLPFAVNPALPKEENEETGKFAMTRCECHFCDVLN